METWLELKVSDSRLTFKEKRANIQRQQRAAEFEHQRKIERHLVHNQRTDSLIAARAHAKHLRKVQAQKLLVAQKRCGALRGLAHRLH